MHWAPRFETTGWTGCNADDSEWEGRSFAVYWLGFTVEIVFARFARVGARP